MFKLTSERWNAGSKLFALLSLTLMVLSFTTGKAFAQSPHFLSTSASGVDSAGNLVVSWKEAGLGNDGTVTYMASANATATYWCLNGGGKHPSATNKTTVNSVQGAQGTFPVTKNGSITGSLTIEPPSSGSFSCPSGQTLFLESVSYTDVTLEDTTNGITADGISGTYSRTFTP